MHHPMQTSNKVYEWINNEEVRRKIVTTIQFPLTSKQISKRTGIPMDTCCYIISKLQNKGLVTCLNPDANKSRIYSLTNAGNHFRKNLCIDWGIDYLEYDLPNIDWKLLGWVSFEHRAAILKILTYPMQPSEIKRQLLKKYSRIAISANNVRDIIKLFEKKGIVEKVYLKKKVHPQYILTDIGKKLQGLLHRIY